MKRFKDYITEQTKTAAFVFGRFNPPTVGHEKVFEKLKSIAGSNPYRIYASHSNDAKKNPLDFETKVKYLRKMFPRHARNIMADGDAKNVFDISVKFYDQGYNNIIMVVGSDRVTEFETLLNKYNGVKGRHGFYQFANIEIVSAGERDPDADDVAGMSASKLRAAAADNDFVLFSKGMPRGFKEAQQLFNDIRKGMNLAESIQRNHIKLKPVSETREAYVAGELFNEGQEVIISESGEVCTITYLGANYIIVETADGKKTRKWLTDVESLDEADKYYSGLGKSTKDKRAAQFKKQAEMDDDNPAAYKPAPGDARAETKPSQYTKKYKQMFDEEAENLDEQNIEKALRNKSADTGVAYNILKDVYDRGVAAWRTGHRPGTTPSQWGLARVNSFVTGGKTQKTTDKDLWDKHKGKSEQYDLDEISQEKLKKYLNKAHTDQIQKSMSSDELWMASRKLDGPIGQRLKQRSDQLNTQAKKRLRGIVKATSRLKEESDVEEMTNMQILSKLGANTILKNKYDKLSNEIIKVVKADTERKHPVEYHVARFLDRNSATADTKVLANIVKDKLKKGK